MLQELILQILELGIFYRKLIWYLPPVRHLIMNGSFAIIFISNCQGFNFCIYFKEVILFRVTKQSRAHIVVASWSWTMISSWWWFPVEPSSTFSHVCLCNQPHMQQWSHMQGAEEQLLDCGSKLSPNQTLLFWWIYYLARDLRVVIKWHFFLSREIRLGYLHSLNTIKWSLKKRVNQRLQDVKVIVWIWRKGYQS